MLRPPLRAVGAALLALVLAACAGGGANDDPDKVKERVADQLVDQGFAQEDADCYADVVVDEVGAENVADLDFSEDAPPAEQREEFARAAARALTECDIDLDSLGGQGGTEE